MRKILALLFLGVFCWLSAQSLQMKPGESKIFKTKQPINTIFASDPKILDYQIIDPHTVAIYSIKDGYGEIRVFGSDKSNTILDVSVNVDTDNVNLKRIARLIERQNPDSSIVIEKLTIAGGGLGSSKKGYIISGTVPNEESRDKAYITAATALGLTLKSDKVRRQNASQTSSTGVQSGASAGGSENLSFLEKSTADGLVDDLKVTSPKQLNVKLIVADVEKNMIDKMGIEFNDSNIFRIPILTPGQSSFLQGIKTVGILGTIQAIESERLAKILATPNISVLSGESASIQVTSQYTPISSTVSNSGAAVSSLGTPVDYGVSLTVQPKIFSKDRIVLNISQEVSSIQDRFEKSGAAGANLKKRITQSVFELADGDSFVIGGLVDERDIEQDSGIPGLKNVPILGAAFKNTNIARSKTELVVIATVNIAEPTNEAYVEVPSFKSKSTLKYMFNVGDRTVRDKGSKEIMNFLSNVGFIK